MKIRILSLACVMTAAALLAACTAVYKNSDACEQLMRSKLAEKSSDTLKIANRGVGIGGSRVVVEGSIEHVPTASEVAAVAASSAGAVSAASAVSAGGASGVSGADALSLKPAKPKKVVQPAAAECTFHGSTLNAFNWLAPARLAAPADENHGEAAQ
jgi:hypothetical protein